VVPREDHGALFWGGVVLGKEGGEELFLELEGAVAEELVGEGGGGLGVGGGKVRREGGGLGWDGQR